MDTIRARTFARLIPLLLGLLLILAGCSTSRSAATVITPAASTATPIVAITPTSPAVPTASPTAVAPRATSAMPPAITGSSATTPTANPSAATTSTPTAEVTAAIKAVIQQADDEQQRAFAAQNPTLMRDTATADYYAELVQTNQDLADNGVSAIALIGLEWGTLTQQSPISVEATVYETWRTTYTDGTTEQGRELNVYTVVQQGGAWKVQADAHPDDQATPGSTGNSGGTGGSGSGSTTPLPAAPTGPGQSNNWSGYAATGGTYTAVSGSWTVPQVTAASVSGADATWVGIGGVTSHDLIQAGTDATVTGGRVRYTAWVEMLPQSAQQVPLVVNPGDNISVAITQQADGTWLIAFQNQTTGKAYQVTETYTSTRSSAEWVEEAPSSGRQVVSLDNFGTVQFQAASAVKDGQQVSIAQANGKSITMIDQTGQILATPSALGSDGASFSVQRSAVVPISPAPTTPRRSRPTPTSQVTEVVPQLT